MAFDTGATSTVITPFLVRQLDLTPSTASYLMASATGVETVRGYRLGCLQLAEEKLENLEVTALSLPGQLQLDGLLGLNFLSHFVVTLDYSKMQVRLERIQTV
jgi:predicted aspartyl protease